VAAESEAKEADLKHVTS